MPPSAILHRSPHASTTLIDIPLSLALAQHFSPPSTLHRPLSTPAPPAPYPSTEPKTGKARQRVIERLGDDGKPAVDEGWIREGLEELGRGYGDKGGAWCGERKVAPGIEGGDGKVSGKRKRGRWGKGAQGGKGQDAGDVRREEAGDEVVESREDEESEQKAMGLRSPPWRPGKPNSEPIPEPCLRVSSIGDESWEVAAHNSTPLFMPTEDGEDDFKHLSVKEVGNRLVTNPSESELFLTLHLATDTGISSGSPTYTLPSLSSFLLSTITRASTRTFSEAAYAMLPTHSKSAGPGQFDFVLLDPPWQNRSVRRSKRYGTMESVPRYEDLNPLVALEGMLGRHIAPEGLVGCWITNKVKARKTALRLFGSWGVHLQEEWVWLKVTSKGEPVTELGGLWRKPYEVLLLGRKARKDEDGMKLEGGEDRAGKRRLLIAVPDLHSRKPNLKELIEPMMLRPGEYRALEVFARNLTAGWWAWGDECLKYNWTDFWLTDA